MCNAAENLVDLAEVIGYHYSYVSKAMTAGRMTLGLHNGVNRWWIGRFQPIQSTKKAVVYDGKKKTWPVKTWDVENVGPKRIVYKAVNPKGYRVVPRYGYIEAGGTMKLTITKTQVRVSCGIATEQCDEDPWAEYRNTIELGSISLELKTN